MSSVYEVNAGSAIAQVEGYCRHLTTGGTFDTLSQPTRTWINDQLILDSSYIAAKLEAYGYSSIQTDEDVIQLLQSWNVVRTVIAIELSNPVESISGRSNARFQEFLNQGKALEAVACSPGLSNLGAAVSIGAGDLLQATGVSADRKKAVEDDTDHIKHRLRRGQFGYPSTSDPHADTDDVIT